VCGVAPGSYGSKELHYILRTLSPAACRNHLVFTEVAKAILRINLVTLPKRGIVSLTGVMLAILFDAVASERCRFV